MSATTQRWQRIDIMGCFRREREALNAVEGSEGDRASLQLRYELASTARWVAGLFEPRYVEIHRENVAMLERYLALVEAGEKPPGADSQVDGIVEAIDGVVAAAAYMAAETVGSPGENCGHWVGRTLGEEQPGDRLRFSALCEQRHWIEVSCSRDGLERGEHGGVILDAELHAHRSSPQAGSITVATGRLIVVPGDQIGFLGGVEVTEEADEWLWNEVAAFEMLPEISEEAGLEL